MFAFKILSRNVQLFLKVSAKGTRIQYSSFFSKLPDYMCTCVSYGNLEHLINVVLFMAFNKILEFI